MSAKPLLLVDVDGVISLFGFGSDDRPAGRWLQVEGMPHLLSSTAGAHLLELGTEFELVWCTGWEERANEHLVRELGLPGPLPHLRFDRAAGPGRSTAGHWKLGAIDAYAGPERALAWIDDALSDACHAWATARRGPTLLVETRPQSGLTDAHTRELHTWAAQVQGD